MGFDMRDVARMGRKAQRQILHKLQEKTAEKAASGKYHNVPTTVGNIRFDSRKEARRYGELMVLLKAGRIRNLRLQAQYTLVEGYTTPQGDRVRPERYVADFAYQRATQPDCAGEVHWIDVVEDVKSRATRTAVYMLKKKQMLDRYGIRITEV